MNLSKLRYIISAAAVVSAFAACTQTYAFEVQCDNVKEQMIISGNTETANEYVTVAVFPQGTSPSAIGDYAQLYQTVSDNDGIYSYCYRPDMLSGKYIIRIKSAFTGITEEKSIDFFNFDELKNSIAEINSKNAAELKPYLEENRTMLGIDSELYNYAVQKGLDLSAVYTAVEQHSDFSGFSDFVPFFASELNKAVCSSGDAKAAEIMLKSLDGIKTMKAYKVFGEFEQKNRERVYTYTAKSSIKNDAEIQKTFARAVILEKVRISAWTEVISLLDNNVDDAAELNLTKYRAHKTESAKNTAGKDLSFLAFQAALDTIPAKTETGGGGGGSGSGGTKGSSAPISSAPVGAVYPETPSESENSSEFTDLNGYEWAADGIKALAAKGIVNGVGGAKFEPERTITREEFAAVITRAFNIPSSKNPADFQDVTASAWYSEPIAALCEYGIANGVGYGFFGVGNDITRQDLCVMLCRTLEKSEFTFGGEDMNFTDIKDIASYAYEAVGKMKHEGFISGFEDGSFKPEESATRAQAAKIIFDILGKKGDI